MTPLVSIVVPTLNQARYIEQTLASIVGQGWPRLELIVIDGGSTDGTREIAERYPLQHFVSEPDGGQAAAINKGFRLAKGDILAWLNSDDYYLPLAISRAVAALDSASLVYGNALLLFEEERRAELERAPEFDREALRSRTYIIQPSTFWTRALWEKAGELNEQLHYVLDWDWWLRASQHAEFRHVDETLSVYRFHAQHKSSSGNPKRAAEILALVEQHAEPEWVAAFRDVAAHLKTLSAARIGRYRWHKWRHPSLLLRHGARAEVAFWQLHG